MFENIILGIIQGIAEWLPVSSEGSIVLAKTYFFEDGLAFGDIIKLALFLHLGTFLAALIYFHKDVATLFKALGRYKSSGTETQKILQFLFLTTLISSLLGLGFIMLLSEAERFFESAGRVITIFVGGLLIITGWLQLKAREGGIRKIHQLKLSDSLTLGVVQGLAAMPGFSRSGLTISTLLLLKMDKTSALRLSFLMSLPIVLVGNLVLNFSDMQFTTERAVGLGFSFLFGLATIHGLLRLAEKINFGAFVIFFGIIAVFAAFI